VSKRGIICELDSLVKPGQVLRLYRIAGELVLKRLSRINPTTGERRCLARLDGLSQETGREWVAGACEHGRVFGGGAR
jgi:hypothetical protein